MTQCSSLNIQGRCTHSHDIPKRACIGLRPVVYVLATLSWHCCNTAPSRTRARYQPLQLLQLSRRIMLLMQQHVEMHAAGFAFLC